MISRAELKQQAKESMLGRTWQTYWILLLVELVTILMLSLTGGFSFLFVGCICFGLTVFWLNFSNGKGEISNLLLGFKEWKRAIPLMFLLYVFQTLWFLVFLVPGVLILFVIDRYAEANAISFSNSFFVFFGILSYLLSIIFVHIKLIPYSQAFFLMVEDKNITSCQALKKSREMMMGYKMDYFILALSFLGWFLLVCLISCICGGIIIFFWDGINSSEIFIIACLCAFIIFSLLETWLNIYIFTTYANFYKAIRGPLTQVDNSGIVVTNAD